MSSRIFFVLILLIPASLIDAQNEEQDNNKIEGRVSDLADSTSLPGVNIFIKELKTGTATDKDGTFRFNHIRKGIYTLQFSYVAHKSVIMTVNVPSEEARNLEIYLAESSINLDEVFITGNPFLSDVKDLSQSVISVEKLELLIKTGRTTAEVLNFQPGIAVRSNGLASARPVIRGFSSNKVLILEDGLRMGDLSNSSDDHAVSNDGSGIEKIEIIEGPSSLLYGSNAIGGVVNIITDAIPSSVQNGLNGEAQLSGASVNNEYQGSAHINYGTGILSVHGKFMRRKGEDYRTGNGTATSNSGLQNTSTLAGISILPEWGIAGLSYENLNYKYGLPSSLSDDERVSIRMKKDQFKFTGSINNINSFITAVEVKTGVQLYHHKEISGTTGEIGTEFGLTTAGADISLQHRPVFSNSAGVIGLYGLIQDYTVTGEEALTPEAKYRNYAAYFLEKFKWKNFNFSFGLRYESNIIDFPAAVLTDSSFGAGEKIFSSLSASAGLIYNFTEHISIFSNFANAFRSPSIEELSSYAVHKALASFDIGDRNLKKENSAGIDFGLRSRYDNYLLEVSGYYYRIFDLIFRRPLNEFYSENTDLVSGSKSGFNDSGLGVRVHKYSQADADVYGFETKFNIELFRGFTATLISDYVRGKIRNAENLPQMPPFRFSAEARYTAHNYWLGAAWNAAAEQNKAAENEEKTAGYGLLNLYAGIKLFQENFVHIISLKAENILDQPYKDHLSSIKDFSYMPGRNFSLLYKFVF